MKKAIIAMVIGLFAGRGWGLEPNHQKFYTLVSGDGNQLELAIADVQKYAPGLALSYNQESHAAGHRYPESIHIDQFTADTLNNFGHLFSYSIKLQHSFIEKKQSDFQEKQNKIDSSLFLNNEQKIRVKEALSNEFQKVLSDNSRHLVEILKKEVRNITDIKRKVIPLLEVASRAQMPYLESALAAVAAHKVNFNKVDVWEKVSSKEFPLMAQLALLWYIDPTINFIENSYAWLRKIITQNDYLKNSDVNYSFLLTQVIKKINQFTAASLEDIIKGHSEFKDIFAHGAMKEVAESLKQEIIERNKNNPISLFIKKFTLKDSSGDQELFKINAHFFAVRDQKNITVFHKNGNRIHSFHEEYKSGIALLNEKTAFFYPLTLSNQAQEFVINLRSLKTGKLLSQIVSKNELLSEIKKLIVVDDQNVLILTPQGIHLYNLFTKAITLVDDTADVTSLLMLDADHYLYARGSNLFLRNIKKHSLEKKWEFGNEIIDLDKIDVQQIFLKLNPRIMGIFNLDTHTLFIIKECATHLTAFNPKILKYPYIICQTVKANKLFLQVINSKSEAIVSEIERASNANKISDRALGNFIGIGNYVVFIKNVADRAHLIMHFIPEITDLHTILSEISGTLYPPHLSHSTQQQLPVVPSSLPEHVSDNPSLPSESTDEPDIMTREEYEQRQAAKKAKKSSA